jgi:uncharacterized protein
MKKDNCQTFYIKGMHCSSCEVLIEKEVKKIKGVKNTEASLPNKTLKIELAGGTDISEKDINQRIGKHGYSISKKKPESKESKSKTTEILLAVGIVLGFLILSERSGVGNLVNVSSTSSLPTFLAFGLIAGVSSCAALVGGLLISLTKKWNDVYIGESVAQRSVPFVLFNTGRLVSFAILGGVLGLIGNFFNLSTSFTAALVIGISALMVVLGLQMMGVEWANKVRISMPKRFAGKAMEEDKMKGKFLPLSMGALTFFFPCGFTIVAQTMALSSGSFVMGSMIMLFFAIGTLPMLAFLSFSSIKLTNNPKVTAKFNYIAGVIVILFAAYNLNSQLNVLGLKSASDLSTIFSRPERVAEADIPLSDGYQVIKMEASSKGYFPRYIQIKAGVPTRWEIEDKGTTGCTNAIIARGLINGSLPLERGMNVFEFTPNKKGVYKATCWMGMVPPVTIEVV